MLFVACAFRASCTCACSAAGWEVLRPTPVLLRPPAEAGGNDNLKQTSISVLFRWVDLHEAADVAEHSAWTVY